MTFKQLRAARVVHWPRCRFDDLKKLDRYFPKPLRDGRALYYDVDEMQAYVDRYWEAKREEQWEREAPAREAQRLADTAVWQENRRAAYRRVLAWLDQHPGLAERLGPYECFFDNDSACFYTPPPEEWEPVVYYPSAFQGGTVSVDTIMARPLPDPPNVFDRTFGGIL